MSNNIEGKTIIIRKDLEKRLEEIISKYPKLNFNFIVNEALEEWLEGSQAHNFKREPFITNAPQGFGPTLLKESCEDTYFRWRK